MQVLTTVLVVLLLLAAFLALFSRSVARRVDKALPPLGQWLEVEGERIHWRELGSGPAIVLVHGLGGQMRNFDYLPLQELAARHRLVLIDRPGSGHSPRSDERRAGIAAQAGLVAGFIRAMDFPQPPLLLGHSLGGAIALGVALQDPGCIAGLALVAPLTHFIDRPPPPMRALAVRSPLLRRLFGHLLAVPLAIANRRRTLEWVFGPDAAPPDFPLRGGGLLGLRPTAYYAASTDLCAVEHDLPAQQQRYGELRLPVHILYGTHDRILDWHAQGQALADKVPQARLETVPGGHMLPVTAPAATAAWLARVAAACQGPRDPRDADGAGGFVQK